MNPQELGQYNIYQKYFTKSLNQDVVKLIEYLKEGFNKNNSLENCLLHYHDRFTKEKWTEIINNWLSYLKNSPSESFISKIHQVLKMDASSDKYFMIELLNLIFSEIWVVQFGDLETQLVERDNWWGGNLETDPLKETQTELKNKMIKLFGQGELCQHLFININREN
jgi:hypothetical protein